MNYIKFFKDVATDQLKIVGGKALSLSNLKQAGFNVPDGFVITTDAYRDFKGKEIAPEFKRYILDAFDALEAERVAVRSSAVAEDSPEASWAGQFESYLNVTRTNLIRSVEQCWESTSTEVVRDYAASKSINEDDLAIAVVIQKMIDSDVSGIAFSVNPITKNSDEIMVEAIFGLGELIVQGMINPDNYLIDKNSNVVLDRTVPRKPNMMVYKDGKNIEELVPPSIADTPCLDDENLSKLSEIIKEIELNYGSPQDIEWAYYKNQFFILQSRPITTL